MRSICTLMSAVTSANSGFADLSLLLSSTGSASISSALSSPTVQSALKSAPPGDLVQLSQQALQLQEVSGLFASSTPQTLLFQALNSAITGSAVTGSTSGSTASTSTAATATAISALEQASALLGTNSSSGSLSFLA